MLASLVAIALLSQDRARPGLDALTLIPSRGHFLELLLPHPTGHNGLEEYLRACDVLDQGFDLYQSWQPPEKRPTPAIQSAAERAKEKLNATGETLSPDEVRLQNERAAAMARINAMSFLASRRDEWNRYGRALDIVESGNQKPIQWVIDDPLDTKSFPIYASFRSLARLACDGAFVAWSSGRSDQAVHRLLVVLAMSQRTQVSGIVSLLVTEAITSIIYREFQEGLPNISLDDAYEIKRVCRAILADRSGIEDAFRAEFRNQKSMFDATIFSVTESDGNGSKLSPDQKVEFQRKITDALQAKLKESLDRLEGPEDAWIPPISKQTPVEAVPLRAGSPDVAEAVNQFLGNLRNELNRDVLKAVSVRRTQTRLLNLHSAIRLFKWENRRLPENLEELKLEPEEVYDPLSKKAFAYHLQSDHYDLFSHGTAETGEIRLVYRGPANTERDPDRP